MKLTDAFICDIDGTVADHENLRGHYEYEKVLLDRPILPVIEVVLHMMKRYKPIFVTGRPDTAQCRTDTMRWLASNIMIRQPAQEYWTHYGLHMRPEFLEGTTKPDYRPDYIVKEEIFSRFLKNSIYKVKFAVDDRLQVCRMWHRIGIPVFRVGDPDADF